MLPFPDSSWPSKAGKGERERRPAVLVDAIETLDVTVPVFVVLAWRRPFELALAVRVATDKRLDVDGLLFAAAPSPLNEGFFALGIGGFDEFEVAVPLFDAVLLTLPFAVEAAFAAAATGFDAVVAGAGVGAPAPRFQTLLTNDFAEDRKPKREVAPFA